MTGATQPFELVLGQSVNKGWQAVARPGPGAAAGTHAVDLGTPHLVDGFANGWQVSAADLRAARWLELHGRAHLDARSARSGPRWPSPAPPCSSASSSGSCPRRARRWVRGRLPRRLRGPAGPEPPERPAVPFDAAVLAFPGAPPPKEQRRARLAALPRALLIGVVTGGVAWLVTPPAAALVVAGVVMLGLLVPWARAVASVGAHRCHRRRLHQRRPGAARPPLPGRDPTGTRSFVNAGNLIWLGVVLLLADAVISGLGLRVRKPLRRAGSCAPWHRATIVPASPAAADDHRHRRLSRRRARGPTKSVSRPRPAPRAPVGPWRPR